MKVKEILKGCAWGLLGLLVLTIAALIIIAIVVGDEEDEQPTRATQPAPAQVTARAAQSTPTKEPTVVEGIRQTSLNHEYSAGIVVDDSMSDELLQALYFYDLYLNRAPRQDVHPDDLPQWCMRPVYPMIHYMEAPDQEKAPIIEERRRQMEHSVLNCLKDPEYTRKEVLVTFYYDVFETGFEDFRVSPTIMLALHHMGIMHMALGYRHTLNDITNECLDAYSQERAYKKCFAERLITEVPIAVGYQYEFVRGLMD